MFVYRIECEVDHTHTTWKWSKLFHFLRGSTAAHIESLSFNTDSTLLSVSGDSGTLHIFELSAEQTFSPSGFKSMLPSLISNRMIPRASRKLRLRDTSNCISCILVDAVKGTRLAPGDGIDSERRIFVSAADGYLYEYELAMDDALAAADTNESKQKPPTKHVIFKSKSGPSF